MPALRITGMLVVACLVSPGLAAANDGAVSLPQTMQAAAIDRAGGPEVITLHTLLVPKPAADEVVIAVDTAGVAIWDAHLRRHPQSITHSAFPLVLGTDGAGTVAAVGEKVKRFKVGDQVYSYSWDNPHGGFYAEYVAVPAERVGHVPQGLTLQQAGAVATTGLTAIQGIDDALRLKAGDTLIIHGASGGVGSLALQFAKLRGVKVLATASGEDGLTLVKGLGADAVVDGRKGIVDARCDTHRHLSAPQGREPRAHHRARASLALRAAGRGHAVGAYHRQERQRRNAHPLPRSEHAGGDPRARGRGPEALHPQRRALQHQVAEPHRPVPTAGRAPRRPPSRRPRLARGAAPPRSQDRQYHPPPAVRPHGDRGRHTHLPCCQSHRARAGQHAARSRGRARRQHPARVPQGRPPLAHPARALRLHRT